MLPKHDRILAWLALLGAICALFQCWLAYVVTHDDAFAARLTEDRWVFDGGELRVERTC